MEFDRSDSIALPQKHHSAAQLQLAKWTFQDVDELEQGLKFLGSRPTQLTCGKLQANLTLLRHQDLQITFANCQQSLRVWGLKPVGTLRFYITPAITYRSPCSHGFFVCPNTIFGFDATRETNIVLPENHQGIVISIAQNVFESYANLMGRFDLDHQFLKQNLVRVKPEAIAPLKQYLQQIHHLINQNPTFFRQEVTQTSFLQTFIPLLISSLESTCTEPKTISTAQRIKLLKQVEEHGMTNLHHPVTLRELCQAIGCRERMLFYRFQELFGMGPIAYLKFLRLNQVYKALKVAEPDSCTVIDVATTYGFWSMNHFSRDYKRMFGELPSETLKRTHFSGLTNNLALSLE